MKGSVSDCSKVLFLEMRGGNPPKIVSQDPRSPGQIRNPEEEVKTNQTESVVEIMRGKLLVVAMLRYENNIVT
jgi:hypothetical protein